MRTVRVRECIAQMVGLKNPFEGSFVRLEVLRDTKSFWLKKQKRPISIEDQVNQ